MLRRLRNLSLVMVLTAAVVLGVSPASPAAAATGCGTDISRLFGFVDASCKSGSYAVEGRCKNWLGYQQYTRGPRVNAPQLSLAYCPTSTYYPYYVSIIHYS